MFLLKEILSKKDRAWLRQATKIAKTSTCRIRHGAILVSGGAVQSVGVNRFRNHPAIVTTPNEQCTYHAEFVTLKAVDFDAPGATLYIARASSSGGAAESKPCDNCIKIIKLSGVKTVIYTKENLLEV